MDLQETIESRRSIHNYKKKDIPYQLLAEIINSATFAPSTGNLQNWRFIIVKNELKKEQLSIASLNQSWMKYAPVVIAICSDQSQIEKLYNERAKLYSTQNCFLATQNILLKATSLGLSTCIVSIFDENAIFRVLSIPDNAKPELLITLGYADEEPEEKSRLTTEKITYFEEYGKKELDFKFLPLKKQKEKILKKTKTEQDKVNSFFKNLARKL